MNPNSSGHKTVVCKDAIRPAICSSQMKLETGILRSSASTSPLPTLGIIFRTMQYFQTEGNVQTKHVSFSQRVRMERLKEKEEERRRRSLLGRELGGSRTLTDQHLALGMLWISAPLPFKSAICFDSRQAWKHAVAKFTIFLCRT